MEYQHHFASQADYKQLVCQLHTLHTPKPKKKEKDIVTINIRGNWLFHNAYFMKGCKRLQTAVTICFDDPCDNVYLPKLANILFSLNITLHITCKQTHQTDDQERLFDDLYPVLSSRALWCFLYYLIAHQLRAQTYTESLATATVWMDTLSMQTPQRPVVKLRMDTQGNYNLTLKVPHNKAQTTLSRAFALLYCSEVEAWQDCDCLADYLHNSRLDALDPYGCFGFWFHLEGPGDLVRQYWQGHLLPGLSDEEGERLLNIVHARGIALYQCALPGIKEDLEDCCLQSGHHLCVQASTSSKAKPWDFELLLVDLLPHQGCGPLRCPHIQSNHHKEGRAIGRSLYCTVLSALKQR